MVIHSDAIRYRYISEEVETPEAPERGERPLNRTTRMGKWV